MQLNVRLSCLSIHAVMHMHTNMLQTTLLAYNVEKNSDIFFKQVPDGINKMIFGMMPGIETPLAVVGGNCSIQGFDATGQELFWTVTGDNVSALSFCDADGDGENELLVGCDDFNIRIFQQVCMCVCVCARARV